MGPDLRYELHRILTAAEDHLQKRQTAKAFFNLCPVLTEFVAAHLPCQPARHAARLQTQDHSVFSMLMEDPYSKRAFAKPRGYAGDAIMLDYVYAAAPPEGTSDVGKVVYTGTALGPMGLSVLFRKRFLAALIDSVLAKNPRARILSVAAGHCRELQTTLAVANGASGAPMNWELVALDQDRLSCRQLAEVCRDLPVKVVCVPIASLLGSQRPVDLGTFDLIYSAGLLDYLPDEVAGRLLRRLSAITNPGGRLFVTNFLPHSWGYGYMELILDWRLLYRSLGELLALNDSVDMQCANRYHDPFGNVGYVEWVRE